MEKKTFSASYRAFWKRIFDYKGSSSLREYWQPVGLHLGLSLAALILWLLYQNNNELRWLSIPFWILLAFLIVSLVPFVSLTVRRLRDTGMSGLWALLLLFVGAGTCVVLALCAGGSGFFPGQNRPVNVYGPPEWFEGTTAFDPSQNEPVDVYGPPEWFDGTKEEEPGSVPETPDFDPENNEPVAVYGPPEWFEGSREEAETVPAPFDPSRNTDAPLYGAPDWQTRSNK